VRHNTDSCMRGRSTTTNLFDFYKVVTKELDNNHSVYILYFDLEKILLFSPAYSLLISKLQKTNIDNIPNKWLRMDWVDVYSGVPQGSVIGLLLFLIYIKDIQDGIISKINIFADDTKMENRAENRFHIKVIRSVLKKLEEWQWRR